MITVKIYHQPDPYAGNQDIPCIAEWEREDDNTITLIYTIIEYLEDAQRNRHLELSHVTCWNAIIQLLRPLSDWDQLLVSIDRGPITLIYLNYTLPEEQ